MNVILCQGSTSSAIGAHSLLKLGVNNVRATIPPLLVASFRVGENAKRLSEKSLRVSKNAPRVAKMIS